MRRGVLAVAALIVAFGLARPAKADLRVEWYGFKLVGSNYGIGLCNSLFLLRWDWFYLEVLRIEGGGAGSGYDWAKENGAFYGKGGFMLGLPIHFGSEDQHEFRIGAGVSGGIMHNEEFATYWGWSGTWLYESNGPFLDLELYYIYRFSDHVGLTVGFATSLVFLYNQPNSHNDTWKPDNLYAGTLGMAF